MLPTEVGPGRLCSFSFSSPSPCLSTYFTTTLYPQSLSKGKPDRPEWLSLSQGLRKILDKRYSEGLSDQEYCGERREAGLLDKTNRQLEDKGRHLSHSLDPVCVLIQLVARFSPISCLLLTINNINVMKSNLPVFFFYCLCFFVF